MRTVLSSPIEVHRVAMFAEMAWLERRPELGLVCRAARQHHNQMSEATVQSVLPGLTDAGARNVLRWCYMLKLCDAQGGLTALGEDVAEHDEAPVPEQGVYGMWLAEHPVFGRRILSVERRSSTRDQRFDEVQPLGTEPDRGVVFRSVVDSKQRFMLRDLPANHGQPGCLPGTTRATCRLRWTLDFDSGRDQWQLDGVIEAEGGMKPMKHEPESASLDLWALASIWATGPFASFGRWQAADRRLAVARQSATDAEQDSFLKTLKVKRLEVPGKGTYDDVTLEDVPIGPTTSEEAQQWALGRFSRHLTRHPAYRSRGELRQVFAELTEGTPLERFAPTLPAHDALMGGNYANQPELFWAFAAPVDLAPRPVPAEELAAMRIGSAAPEAGVEAPSLIRIPYRGAWTMRRLVERLTGGLAPRKVLMSDRYVRGDDNLATLRVLVQALRAVAPAVSIEVWTGDEDADFKQIQAITGSPPRSYREVYGRSVPHDRYILMVPTTGAGFGWHLSNSPLHARADVTPAGPETPLRWKDLAGARVSAEELEPALRQWLAGGGR
jgi:hypothetical protein